MATAHNLQIYRADLRCLESVLVDIMQNKESLNCIVTNLHILQVSPP